MKRVKMRFSHGFQKTAESEEIVTQTVELKNTKLRNENKRKKLSEALTNELISIDGIVNSQSSNNKSNSKKQKKVQDQGLKHTNQLCVHEDKGNSVWHDNGIILLLVKTYNIHNPVCCVLNLTGEIENEADFGFDDLSSSSNPPEVPEVTSDTRNNNKSSFQTGIINIVSLNKAKSAQNMAKVQFKTSNCDIKKFFGDEAEDNIGFGGGSAW